MQETRRADLRQLEVVTKEAEEAGTADHVENNPEKDPATALQLFLDRITINNSIPGIKNAPVVDLKTGDTVKDAIELLYTKNAFGAPIADVLDPDITVCRFSDRYIGFIDFATMVLWSLEECEKARVPIDGHACEQTDKSILLSLLEQNPEIGDTKVGELAKSFLWNPFFPVRLEDTIFHVLLLLSKHRVQVVPVVEQSDLLLENDNLFKNRKIVTLEEFIHMETRNPDSDPTIERNIRALLSAGVLHLRNNCLPRMDSPVTNKKTDTLKQAMKNVAENKSNFSFQVDDLQRPLGILTLRDIILQFAPPSMNSNINGGGFFETALEQTGCQVKNGTLVSDH